MDNGIRVVMKGGIDVYMAAADETLAELMVSEDGPVAALREYDDFFSAAGSLPRGNRKRSRWCSS